MKKETLLAGDGAIEVELPDRARTVGGGFGTKLAPLPDLRAAVRQALDRPEGLPPLGDLVRPGARVTIAFDDPTVPSFGPVREVAIGLVLEELGRAGVRDDRITLLCANALHRKWRNDELAQILGTGLVQRFEGRLICHDAEDPASLVYLGQTAAHGLHVEVHRLVVESDLTIYVNAQCLRGFTGGWKSICVGLSTWRSISHHHTPDGMSMSFRNNKMHAMLDEMGAHLEATTKRRIFKVETILANLFDAAHVFAGGIDETRARALSILEAQYPPRREAAEPADVVLYGVPGYSPYARNSRMNPLLTLVSSGLGYFGGSIEALGKPGCSVILATPCPDEWDEVSHPSYREVWNRVLGASRDPWEITRLFGDELATRADYIDKYRFHYGFHPIHGIMATHPLKRLRHAARVFVAGIEKPCLAEHLGFIPTATVEEAIARAEEIHGAGCSLTCVRTTAGLS